MAALRLPAVVPEVVGACFAAMRVSWVSVGNAAAPRIVPRIGAYRTSLISSAAMFTGTLIWALGAGFLLAMFGGVILWGWACGAQLHAAGALGGGGAGLVRRDGRAQHVRQLCRAGIGSAMGAEMFSRDLLLAMGYVATVFMLLAQGRFMSPGAARLAKVANT